MAVVPSLNTINTRVAERYAAVVLRLLNRNAVPIEHRESPRLLSLARLALAAVDCQWRTIDGTHVCIGKGGRIEKGPKSLIGRHHRTIGDGPSSERTDYAAADPAERRRAKVQAAKKIAEAPVPSRADVRKARAELERAKAGEGRAGGESRGGSAESRRRQRQNLFREFGGEQKGYVVCHDRGIKMHWTDDPKLNPKGYPKFERGKIFVKRQGGGYQQPNLIPERFEANRARNDTPLRRENLR